MSDKKNENVLKFSAKTRKSVDKTDTKNFCGFEYVKMEKDLNGTPFIKESLLEYADGCRYMVRVMREIDGKISLYNYYVSQDKLSDFLSKLKNGEFDGRLIEVEKYIHEDLA